MEAKLKEYRALRRRKELIDNTKEKIEKSKQTLIKFLIPKIFTNMEKEKKDDVVVLLQNEEPPPDLPLQPEDPAVEEPTEESELESFAEEKQESWRYFIIKWLIYSLTWLTLYIFFLKIQFGAVFFVLSVLIGIYFNTRTRPKKKGEVSAYSVFNENCVSIDGTLKAEQLEREIMYGAGGVNIFR
ncbi:SAYSVFN motif domain containing 1 [Aphomia sociella]